ncbi:hypothetical protein [Pseudomonas sp. QD4]|uniref:hypothetical protein n=1 Tax=Pseudomonas sp. QD4 TaxID=3368618 RepID=UPI003BA19F3C
MSMRRENIEEQAMRLRSYVSEAVCAATGVTLPMTQTLDQMVRAAAKAGVVLSISTETQMHAIEMLSNQLRLLEICLQAERDQLKSELAGLRTGYEAYESVNKGLKAEVEALRKEREGMALVPVTPSEGLLMSMAIRNDHALGCPGYYDQKLLGRTNNGVSHARMVECAIAEMRKLHEEVVGAGFYSPKRESDYAAMGKGD